MSVDDYVRSSSPGVVSYCLSNRLISAEVQVRLHPLDVVPRWLEVLLPALGLERGCFAGHLRFLFNQPASEGRAAVVALVRVGLRGRELRRAVAGIVAVAAWPESTLEEHAARARRIGELG